MMVSMKHMPGGTGGSHQVSWASYSSVLGGATETQRCICYTKRMFQTDLDLGIGNGELETSGKQCTAWAPQASEAASCQGTLRSGCPLHADSVPVAWDFAQSKELSFSFTFLPPLSASNYNFIGRQLSLVDFK